MTFNNRNNLDYHKRQAKQLRNYLSTLGIEIKHSIALEALSRIYGEANFHTLARSAKNREIVVIVDEERRSRYRMKQAERLCRYLYDGGVHLNQVNALVAISLIRAEGSYYGVDNNVGTDEDRTGTRILTWKQGQVDLPPSKSKEPGVNNAV